jgi:pyrroloquinoline quinone biosynthesis protein B|tara:strand:+ start:273 stop:1115 length:843 start_codon:yes stop_codon:yes gene_type:complete
MIIHVLGTAQDGGYPHAGCNKACCSSIWLKPELHRLPSSIAAIDLKQKQFYLFDITPNVKEQLYHLNQYNCQLAGIFITHAHIGHYLGLMDLGLEVMNTQNIPVYVMPRMKNFILNNQPMLQLVENNNIELIQINHNQNILFNNLSIVPFEVPHRNELSETVGFRLLINNNSIVFLPDIDDWNSWEVDLETFVIENDLLFLDGTFYKKSEINSRDVSKIPHPEIIDTMARLSKLSKSYKKRVHFIHLNHTNNALRKTTSTYKNIIESGFSISEENQTFKF